MPYWTRLHLVNTVCVWKSFTRKLPSLGLGTVFTEHSDFSPAAQSGRGELHTYISHILGNPKTTRNTVICLKHREQRWIYSALGPSSCITGWQARNCQLMSRKNMDSRVTQTRVWNPALTVTCWLNFSVTPVPHPFIHPFRKFSLKASCVPDLVAGIGEEETQCPLSRRQSNWEGAYWIEIYEQKTETKGKGCVV